MTPSAGLDHALDSPFPPPRPARQGVAAARLQARRRRITAIRKWVVAFAVALFLAVWAVIFDQLISEQVAAASRSSWAQVGTTHASSGSLAGASPRSSSATSSGAASGSSSGTVSPVTTGQS